MKTPQEIIKEVVSRDTPADQLGSIRSYFVDDYAILAMEAYADQFKPKQYDFPEYIPDPGVRVLAYSHSQGWQVMHRGYELTKEEPYWILTATSERAYLNIIKWQYLPEKPS